ncbi:Uncharacterized protein TCM_016197 [Theobroma cacao]|uniref:Uncharacterized protein n=1 Tax=Theobroma cacao TaxID=3641 RepID=A0A061G530_THECC|nr:Uncharacterized protein TCM_016197 [Theobroma cacao]
MLDNTSHQQFTLEMTVVSAQGLKNTSSSLFSHRLRPFVTITTFPPTPFNGDNGHHMYQTRVDDQGSTGLVPDSRSRHRSPTGGFSQATQLPAASWRRHEDSGDCQCSCEVGRSSSPGCHSCPAFRQHVSDCDRYTGEGYARCGGDGCSLERGRDCDKCGRCGAGGGDGPNRMERRDMIIGGVQ